MLVTTLCFALQSLTGASAHEEAFRLVQELIVPDLRAGDELGAAVAIDGGLLAVSAPKRERPGQPNRDEGAVFVFERGASGGWGLLQELSPPLPGGKELGNDLALSGSTLAVGWSGASGIALFERQGPLGPFVYDRAVSDGRPTFGYSVALDGDLLVGGTPGLETFYCNAVGSSAVFDRNEGGPGAWGAVYLRTGAIACDGEGWDVAISGSEVVMGKPGGSPLANTCFYACTTPPEVGATFLEKVGETWGALAHLGSTPACPFVATSVALEGDTMALSRSGGAILFTRSGSGWVTTECLSTGDPLGITQLALDRGRLLMSAYGHDYRNEPGRVFVHQRDHGGPEAWGRRGRLISPRATPMDRFGSGTAADAGRYLVGAPGDDVMGADAGAAFLFAETVRRGATPTLR